MMRTEPVGSQNPGTKDSRRRHPLASADIRVPVRVPSQVVIAHPILSEPFALRESADRPAEDCSNRGAMTSSVTVSGVDHRVLCAILLNPPLRPAVDTISHRNLLAALPLTGCTEMRLANLIDVPSKDQIQLASTVVTERDLMRSRQYLSAAIEGSDEVLLAWGTRRLTGAVGRLLVGQAAWVREHVKACGLLQVWMVAGTPRHPSRWRQFVGPEKRRVKGASFEERLAKVLTTHKSDVLLNGPFVADHRRVTDNGTKVS